MKFSKSTLELVPIENLIRLCKWEGIHESSDFKRSSLINWLIWQGYCSDPRKGGWD